MKKYIVKAETTRDNKTVKISESGIKKSELLMKIRKQIRDLKGSWVIYAETWEDGKLLNVQVLER
jgi:hypothetical protein